MAAQPHIQNPFEFVLEGLTRSASAAERALRAPPARHDAVAPAVRRIGAADLMAALREGLHDLGVARADVVFLALIYPVAGLVLAALAFQYQMLPLVFPLVSGFALLGPLAAIGLYEISRRLEQGEAVSWTVAAKVLGSPALGSIIGLGSVLLALFAFWMAAAWGIYAVTVGPEAPTSVASFLRDVLTTPAGWTMTVVGVGVGFVFAVVVLAISVISFPLLLDRDVGMTRAIQTSLKAVAANPGTMALWGAIVAGALILGSLPALAGLIFVMPLLGHATWHLYRRLVED
ncbi:DUF2189 domain-containing protein [Phenylobacterium sp. J367]|uniref:DUF2189 domain-containing protein n=1 Tax=Phenylobacterium sp. J367 TaxID=2898435 RepID=UPI0021516609|nr:DUF2189 domain-containing protein [Phenylobacterium sp. J367]MCR5879716.1 DUF2189 domain-containing protein [Phenylobacterium sp. J367]